MSEKSKTLRVGIIGAGLVAQTIHLPVLSLLSHLYTVVAICEVSEEVSSFSITPSSSLLLLNTTSPPNTFANISPSQVRNHCALKFHIPLSVPEPSPIFQHPDIDVVFILTSDQFHEEYTIAALRAGKQVLVEKPLTLSIPAAQRMRDAAASASSSSGAKVFVAYMRRYARSFTHTFLRELRSIDRILYARVRDFPGPNGRFVGQGGAFALLPEAGTAPVTSEAGRDFGSGDALEKLLGETFAGIGEVTEERKKFCRFLGSLGSHDLSVMREALGFPELVIGVSVNDPFYSAMFEYKNAKDGTRFAVTWESGIDAVLDFDAHLAVYGERKRVMIKYDSPFIKGLPIKVTVQEVNDHGEMETREVLGSYEDAFTTELKELYECLVNGRTIKTTVEDAAMDMKLFDMMYKGWETEKTRSGIS